MIIKNNPIIIDKKDPFRNDVLKRKENIEVLTQLLENTEDSMVMAVDSSWGTGKTTFIKMWRQFLINEGFSTIYFNAWENDFSDDALASLIGELSIGFDEFGLSGSEKSSARKLLNSVRKVSIDLIKKTTPTLVKIGTSGLVDLDKLTGGALSEIAGNITEEKIKAYENSRKTVGKFKEKLKKFALKVMESSSGKKPLIIFIDELDRCKPTYAIEIMENAKHLFDTDGIIFVLGIDKEQLGHSIKSVYGNEFGVDGYLKRFIDITYNLPTPNHEDFVEHLFNKFGLTEYLKKKQTNIPGHDIKNHPLFVFLTKYFKYYNLSLRDQEQMIGHLVIVINTFGKGEKINPRILSFILLLKFVEKNLYKKLLNQELVIDEILSFIDKFPNFGFLDQNFSIELKVDIYVLFSSIVNYEKEVENRLDEIKRQFESDGIEESKRKYLESIYLLYERRGFDYSINMKKSINRMEIIDSFK